ncbi:hypothetical protein GGX14DRAFT_408990 [Mycena pura]|uniref:Uncharacterized protein n=1 Tax=Mycena pura TaxID=153505 RepID=A0AAD6UK14_9AGAR|nr:hypothetical protein GGX14DRAFT_408990 [Mycena pura]
MSFYVSIAAYTHISGTGDNRASSQPLLCSFGIPGNEDDYAVRRPRTRTSSLSTYRTLTPTPTPTSTSTHATTPSAASSRAAAAALWISFDASAPPVHPSPSLAYFYQSQSTRSPAAHHGAPPAVRVSAVPVRFCAQLAPPHHYPVPGVFAGAGTGGNHSADVPRGSPCAQCVAREHGPRGCGCGAARVCAAGVTAGTQAGARMAGRTHGRAAASGAHDSVDPGVDVYRGWAVGGAADFTAVKEKYYPGKMGLELGRLLPKGKKWKKLDFFL